MARSTLHLTARARRAKDSGLVGATCCHWLRAGFRTLLGKDEGPVVSPLATAESDPSETFNRSAPRHRRGRDFTLTEIKLSFEIG